MKQQQIEIRLATEEDLESIEALMKSSMRTLGQGYYSEQQIQSCCHYVCVPQLQLIRDQTFFVAVTADGSIVGCGGWSFRKTLYAGPQTPLQEGDSLNPEKEPARIRSMFVAPSASGKGIGSLILSASEKAARKSRFQRGVLGATLSGLAFYKSKGWASMAELQATLPDGVVIGIVKMEKLFEA